MLDGDGDRAPAGAPAQAALSASVLAAARAVLSHSTGGAAPKSDDRAALVELLSFVKRMLPAGSATTAAAAAGGGATRASRLHIDLQALPPSVAVAAAALSPAGHDATAQDQAGALKGHLDALVRARPLEAARLTAALPAEVLACASAIFEDQMGRPAESEREGLLLLRSILDRACAKPLKPGREGGGGVRLRPPRLRVARSCHDESARSASGAWGTSAVERVVRDAAASAASPGVGAQAAMQALCIDLEERLYATSRASRRTAPSSGLPAPVEEGLRAEWSARSRRPPSHATADDVTAVGYDLIAKINADASRADADADAPRGAAPAHRVSALLAMPPDLSVEPEGRDACVLYFAHALDSQPELYTRSVGANGGVLSPALLEEELREAVTELGATLDRRSAASVAPELPPADPAQFAEFAECAESSAASGAAPAPEPAPAPAAAVRRPAEPGTELAELRRQFSSRTPSWSHRAPPALAGEPAATTLGSSARLQV